MDVHGNLNLLGNFLEQAGILSEVNFPVAPSPGRLFFRESDRMLYICVEVDVDLPVWMPLVQLKQYFKYVQSTPALEWTITHDLNLSQPLVQVYDDTGKWVIPDQVICDTLNQVTVVFTSNASGTAVLMGGDGVGVAAAQPAYMQSFTSSTTWVVDHNLGYHPSLKVYVNNEEVEPASIVHDSNLQATITFTTARAGFVRAY